MIKKNLKLLLITSGIILLPILAGLILWDSLSEQIPIHWNAAGEVDGYAGKTFSVFGIPGIMLVVHWLAVLATSADPKKQNHTEKVLALCFWLVPALSVLLSAVTYSAALGKNVRVEMILPVFLGLLFVAIGNYLPKCRQNYTIGIKIPWTLASEENWNKTHRLAGKIWVAGGLAIMLAGFFSLLQLTLIVVLPMALIPVIYSFLLHRRGV